MFHCKDMFILRKLANAAFESEEVELKWYAQYADIVIRSQLHTQWYQDQLARSSEITEKNAITLDCLANIAYAYVHTESDARK